MNKSKSSPNFQQSHVLPMKKSASEGNISQNNFYFDEFFEGDGPLGIVFNQNIKNEIYVEKISPLTVAAETYGLQVGMIVIDIANKDVTGITMSKAMKRIKKEWTTNNRIYLKFKKKIYPEISEILNQYDLFHYYDKFVELGAYRKDDIEFIELKDLVEMNMCKEEILRFKIAYEYYTSSESESK
jgi:hypothetical protein